MVKTFDDLIKKLEADGRGTVPIMRRLKNRMKLKMEKEKAESRVEKGVSEYMIQSELQEIKGILIGLYMVGYLTEEEEENLIALL